MQTIFFDAVGTLIRLRRPVGEIYREVAMRHGADLPAAALQQAFGVVWKSMPPRIDTKVAREDDDHGWWCELVERVLEHCAGSAAEMDRGAFFEELYQEFTQPEVWELFPEVERLIPELARDYTLGIISNFDGRLRTILRDLHVLQYFPHVVLSSECGADKPAPWIFEVALRAAACRPDEAIHAGDDPVADWGGAAAAGMNVFKLQRPANSLEEIRHILAGSEVSVPLQEKGRLA